MRHQRIGADVEKSVEIEAEEVREASAHPADNGATYTGKHRGIGHRAERQLLNYGADNSTRTLRCFWAHHGGHGTRDVCDSAAGG